MIGVYRRSLQRQYGAAICMLRSAIEHCPGPLWTDAADGGPPFWRLAYHTMFYLDLYLSDNPAAFRPAAFHEENAQLFEGKVPWPPYRVEVPQAVHSKQQLLAYLDEVSRRCAAAISRLDGEALAAPSGFEWLPFSRAELMLYNLRHVQHHAGQLGLLMRRRGGVKNAWLGSSEIAP